MADATITEVESGIHQLANDHKRLVEKLIVTGDDTVADTIDRNEQQNRKWTDRVTEARNNGSPRLCLRERNA